MPISLTLQYPDEFVLVGMPVALAGPGAWLDDGYIDTELFQAGKAGHALTGLGPAGLVEGTWVGTAALGWDQGKVAACKRFDPDFPLRGPGDAG